MREKRAKRLRWELMTTLGDYERVGKKDVRWDDAAREALIQNAHLLAGEREADDRRDDIKAAFQKALSVRISFAANAPSKPSRKGSESLSASKRKSGVSARMRRTTSSFSSGSRLHVL